MNIARLRYLYQQHRNLTNLICAASLLSGWPKKGAGYYRGRRNGTNVGWITPGRFTTFSHVPPYRGNPPAIESDAANA